MTRESTLALLGEVLLRLRNNRHVHVCELTPKDCIAFYEKLQQVAQYVAGPQMPTVRKIAQTWSDVLKSRPDKTLNIVIAGEDERLQLLCDAVLLLTAPDASS